MPSRPADSYRATHQTWNKVAASYEAGFMDVSLYAATFDAFCELLPEPDARVLDIGCGPGNVTRYLLDRRPDWRIAGIDVAPAMVERAQANNPTATFRVMEAREIFTLPGPYDGIMCGFCVPYLVQEDTAQLIADCAKLLRAGGILYLSAIEGAYEDSKLETGSTGDQMFVYYYDEATLRKLFEVFGFEVVLLERRVFQRANGKTSPNVILIGRKA